MSPRPCFVSSVSDLAKTVRWCRTAECPLPGLKQTCRFAPHRYWPIADIHCCTAHVRFRGVKQTCRLRESAFAVAIRGKADMGFSLKKPFENARRGAANGCF